ncbi:MAG: flagellar motor switch protein FliN [Actinomycetota bacterium]|jgi:flagellar motor switch protein FliN/FliY|nr:flagellar motor switch protein FliN [Actinomycetota bacterium]
MTAAAPTADQALIEAATRGAAAAAALLPSSSPLDPGPVTTDLTAIDLPDVEARAVCARFTGGFRGEVAVIVGSDLVEALRTSPLGELDLAQAIQPALQAAAEGLGAIAVDPGQALDALLAVETIGRTGSAVAVPLYTGDGTDRTVGAVVLLGIAPAAAAAPTVSPAVRRNGLDLLRDVEMEVTVELGRTRMAIRELLALAPGAVVELDRAAGSPADLLVNGRLIARGEVVVVDEDFGVRITEIVGSHGETDGNSAADTGR